MNVGQQRPKTIFFSSLKMGWEIQISFVENDRGCIRHPLFGASSRTFNEFHLNLDKWRRVCARVCGNVAPQILSNKYIRTAYTHTSALDSTFCLQFNYQYHFTSLFQLLLFLPSSPCLFSPFFPFIFKIRCSLIDLQPWLQKACKRYAFCKLHSAHMHLSHHSEFDHW